MSRPGPGRPGAGGGGATSPAPTRLASDDPQPLAVLLAALIGSWAPAQQARARRALARLAAPGAAAVLAALDRLEEQERAA